jgi:hypothetical protein
LTADGKELHCALLFAELEHAGIGIFPVLPQEACVAARLLLRTPRIILRTSLTVPGLADVSSLQELTDSVPGGVLLLQTADK